MYPRDLSLVAVEMKLQLYSDLNYWLGICRPTCLLEAGALCYTTAYSSTLSADSICRIPLATSSLVEPLAADP